MFPTISAGGMAGKYFLIPSLCTINKSHPGKELGGSRSSRPVDKSNWPMVILFEEFLILGEPDRGFPAVIIKQKTPSCIGFFVRYLPKRAAVSETIMSRPVEPNSLRLIIATHAQGASFRAYEGSFTGVASLERNTKPSLGVAGPKALAL